MGRLVTDQIEKTGAGALSFVVNHAERMSLSDSTGLTVTGNAIVGGHLESRGGGGVVENTSVGFEALKSNTTGLYNTAVGWSALKLGTTGSHNTALGYEALGAAGNSKYNVGIGFEALRLTYSAPNGINAGGEWNTAVGTQAMVLNTIGYENVAVGGVALHVNSTGHRNVAVGFASLRYNTTGANNTAMGYVSLYKNTTGTQNSAFGNGAMEENTIGSYNNAMGMNALRHNTTGSNNVAIGYQTLTLQTLNLCTAIGNRAGNNAIANCTNSTFIGNGAGDATGAPNGSNFVVLGNAAIATLYCAQTSITFISDRRDKTNIVDIPVGLEFVRSLRPVSFDWNMRCGGKVGTPEFGFIAQDLQEVQNTHTVVPGLVDESNPDRLSASPGTLLPVLVKAIQELDKKLQELDKKLQEHIA